MGKLCNFLIGNCDNSDFFLLIEMKQLFGADIVEIRKAFGWKLFILLQKDFKFLFHLILTKWDFITNRFQDIRWWFFTNIFNTSTIQSFTNNSRPTVLARCNFSLISSRENFHFPSSSNLQSTNINYNIIFHANRLQ